jgi:hypothetical protein
MKADYRSSGHFLAALVASALALSEGAAAQPGITAGLGLEQARSGQTVPFWLRVQGSHALDGIGVRLLAVDTELLSLCEKFDASTGCVPPPVSMPAGAQVYLQGLLRIRSSGSHKPTAVVSFRNASSGSPDTYFVPLGEIEVTHGVFAWLDWLKDLAFPAALGFIGFLYQRQQKRIQEAKDAEKKAELALMEKLERERRVAEKRASDRVETLRLMLPLTHRYSTRYYLNLLTAAERFYQCACDVRTAKTPLVAGQTSDEVTFWLAKLVLENRRMHQGVGAYYFTNRSGENLLAFAYGRFDTKFFNGMTDLELAASQLVDELEKVPVLTFARYADLVKDGTAAGLAATLRARLAGWLPDAAAELKLIGAFARVLEFEINRMYETWYLEPEILEIDEELVTAILDVAEKRAPAFRAYFSNYRPKTT